VVLGIMDANVRRIRDALRDWEIRVYVYVRGHRWTWIVLLTVAFIVGVALAASAQDCFQRGAPFYECGVGPP